jgi:hypothetical protein
MSSAARSIFAFGVYVVALGAVIIAAPNVLVSVPGPRRSVSSYSERQC